MPCDCGSPPAPQEIEDYNRREHERIAAMEHNYSLWAQEVPKLRALVKFYQGFMPDNMVENSFHLHHMKMEHELEALRKIVKQAKAGIDITSFIIPEETKDYKRNED